MTAWHVAILLMSSVLMTLSQMPTWAISPEKAWLSSKPPPGTSCSWPSTSTPPGCRPVNTLSGTKSSSDRRRGEGEREQEEKKN